MNVDSSANEQSRGFVITKITERCLPSAKHLPLPCLKFILKLS